MANIDRILSHIHEVLSSAPSDCLGTYCDRDLNGDIGTCGYVRDVLLAEIELVQEETKCGQVDRTCRGQIDAYTAYLRAHSDEDALMDAYNHATELAMYLRHLIEEGRINRLCISCIHMDIDLGGVLLPSMCCKERFWSYVPLTDPNRKRLDTVLKMARRCPKYEGDILWISDDCIEEEYQNRGENG